MKPSRSITRSPLHAQGGFSLIEIILVTVLIGAIVAFAATQIFGGSDKAKFNLAKSQVQTVAQKIEQFEMDTGALPGTLDDLVNSDTTGWLGPYAKAAELKDPWQTPLEYRVPGDDQRFELMSLGADRKAGGKSVDADIKYQ